MEEDEIESSDPVEDIRVPAPRAPEVNPEVYADVLDLLGRGFLTVSADIGGTMFVFKSLNHHEFDMVRLLSGFSERNPVIPPRFWDLFLAHMVLFVDGLNVLADRNRHLSKLASVFRDIPNAARQRLIRQLSDLNRKASKATLLVEAYAMESYSRWRWAQFQGLDLSSSAVTGIDGTDKLGLSYAQLTWRAINHYEDLRFRHEADWENAKFIGGCMAGKGIQKVYNRDNDRKQKDREEKWNRKDQLIRHVLFGESLEPDKKYGGAQVIMVANTVEELAAQVEKSLRGEKDWHDKVVQEYEENIREGTKKREEQLRDLVEDRHKEMGDRSIVGSTALLGLTPAQVAERIAEQRRREAEAMETDGALVLDEKTATALDKWGLRDSGLQTTERSTEGAIPLSGRRSTGKPWR